MAALRSFYAFTFSAGLMRLNVADKLKSFSVQKQNLAKWGTGNEIGRLIDAIDTQQLSPTKKILHKAIISVFLNSGLRVSELVALTLPDVDFAGQRIIVREGKNDKYRIVPMTKPEIARLKEWISLRKRGGLYVFQSERSDQLSVRAVQHILAKLREISGVDLSVHQLRHTFAKRYADANGIGAAAEVLGHSNINTTRVYTAPSMAQHIANANRIATEV
ncbi:Tyrosine recombinase XerC [Paenibacillus pasadenensis]|uniref:Tyrosine recombinase XerC n=2 Tax=Paenibacillus pasadenensis TaxID=217090 RepID=A0A2N5MZK1_9BACL|nr:Tyrosine recombinase XerC [Paenibacillus pasadenensis]